MNRRASNGSPDFPGSVPNHLIIGYADINKAVFGVKVLAQCQVFTVRRMLSEESSGV